MKINILTLIFLPFFILLTDTTINADITLPNNNFLKTKGIVTRVTEIPDNIIKLTKNDKNRFIYLCDKKGNPLLEMGVPLDVNTKVKSVKYIEKNNLKLIRFYTSDKDWNVCYLWDYIRNSYIYGAVKISTGKILYSNNTLKTSKATAILNEEINKLILRLPVKIKYMVEKKEESPFGSLFAFVNGKKYIALDNNENCIYLEKQTDLDDDGTDEAIVIINWGCGRGNAVTVVVCYYDITSKSFRSSKTSFESTIGPVIEEWNGRLSLVTTYHGSYFDENPEQITSRYIFENKDLKIVERNEAKLITAIKEMWAKDLVDANGEGKRIYFDLDCNGKKDVIECHYWPRWEDLLYKITIGGKTVLENQVSTKRIGVLKSKTNGVHDIISGRNDVYKWNGKTYQLSNTPIDKK